LPALYVLLAMRQVLTIPPMDGKERSKAFGLLPKLLLLLPVLVLTAIIAHDISTFSIGSALSDVHTISMLLGSAILWSFVLVLTITCIATLAKIDSVWRECWVDVQQTKNIVHMALANEPVD